MPAAAAGSPATTGVMIPDTNPPPPKPPECPVDNPFCGMTGVQRPPSDCGNAAIDLKPQGVNVMIAVDGSASMAPFWPEVQNAVRRLHSQNPTGGFGVHMFFGNFVEDLDALSIARAGEALRRERCQRELVAVGRERRSGVDDVIGAERGRF